jgi:hypothetical protein
MCVFSAYNAMYLLLLLLLLGATECCYWVLLLLLLLGAAGAAAGAVGLCLSTRHGQNNDQHNPMHNDHPRSAC